MKKRSIWICLFVLLCLAFVAGTQTHRRHNIAKAKIEKSGFNYWDGFEDPVGPNWLFTGRSVVPNDGRFSPWFADLFCLKGQFRCWISDRHLTSDEIRPLRDLVHLRWLQFSNCVLPDDWSETISKCRYLRQLTIIQSQLSTEQIDSMRKLNIGSIELIGVELVGKTDSLISSLSGIRNLRVLYITGSGLSNEERLLIKNGLPNCEVK